MKQEKHTTKTKMTKQELQEWDDLYQYVKTEILNYPSDLTLPNRLVMRLKGLKDGQYYANNKQKVKANYPFSTILLTFKFCKSNILNALQTKQFKNEEQKFNYIMAIVMNNINDIALKLKTKEKSEKVAKKQIDKINIDIPNKINTQQNAKETNKQFNNLTKEMW